MLVVNVLQQKSHKTSEINKVTVDSKTATLTIYCDGNDKSNYS